MVNTPVGHGVQLSFFCYLQLFFGDMLPTQPPGNTDQPRINWSLPTSQQGCCLSSVLLNRRRETKKDDTEIPLGVWEKLRPANERKFTIKDLQ